MLNIFKKENKKVFIGLSGGVDSAVSAFLLKQNGYDVTGVFIKTWQPDYIECTWKEDRLDAMRICAQLNIPFITLDLEKEYKEKVIDYFLEEYKNNRTPNPDIMCNKYIKFGEFLGFARAYGARIATGHYAKIATDNTGPHLVKHKDESKDQSYFLYQIDKNDLDKIIFPLSDLTKKEVREIAKKNNLYVANKKDSMGICMLGGDIGVKDFLIRELNTKKGKVVNDDGDEVGEHFGVSIYTKGERLGSEIKIKTNNTLPYFVYDKGIENNILFVTTNKSKIENINENKNYDNQNTESGMSIIIEDLNSFVNLIEINENKIYKAETRYHGPIYDVKIKLAKESEETVSSNKKLLVTPLTNNFFYTSGQSLVLYDEDKIILGGIIA